MHRRRHVLVGGLSESEIPASSHPMPLKSARTLDAAYETIDLW
jgi:hypothetical protein